MTATAYRPRTFLLTRGSNRLRQFGKLDPIQVSTTRQVQSSLQYPREDTLWISCTRSLSSMLLKALPWPGTRLGDAIFLHDLAVPTVLVFEKCFERAAFLPSGYLPDHELAEVLLAANRDELFLGGIVDHATRMVTFWRGNRESLVVPFSAFPPSGSGSKPEFTRFQVTDFGQTICFGRYEAATEAILYEFDPEYRRRIKKKRLQREKTFGASLRRLRKQRGLRLKDFGVSSRTMGRIERNEVTRIHPKTVSLIAGKLGVEPAEIESY